MEKLECIQIGIQSPVGSPSAGCMEAKKRFVVSPTPRLVFKHSASRPVTRDWTPFQPTDIDTANADVSAVRLAQAGLIGHPSHQQSDIGGGTVRRTVIEEVDTSSLSGTEWKLCRVDQVNPYGTSHNKFQSDLFCPETSGDAGSVHLVTQDKSQKKHARGKYDYLIDSTLTPMQKKKQRRILANRASARRSRQKKKEALTHLLQREQELTQERDAAIAGLNHQIRINVALRQQLQAVQNRLELYQKGNIGGALSSPFDRYENNQLSSSADPFLTVSQTSAEHCFLDPCDSLMWNHCSRY